MTGVYPLHPLHSCKILDLFGFGMNIIVNGKPTETPAGSTVQKLLDRLQLDGRQVVVERNRGIVPRQRFSEELLAEGDVLEVVHFVGGG